MLLIKNIETYSPKHLGVQDILVSYDKILYISPDINIPNKNFPKMSIIQGNGLILIPGIIDLHVHIIGGGGEGGYNTRTPELMLTHLTKAGITTCVGLLGTDGTTRSMGNLLAKARSLEIEGLTTYSWTGCYQMPTRTITDSARGDIILVDKIIGVGEIAVSDHRSSHPSDKDLTFLASEARIGGMLSGKCGILHIHIGDGKNGLLPLFDLHKNSEIPFENILPTHINRNHELFKQSIDYAKMGGFIDITTGITPENSDSVEVNPAKAYSSLLENNISPWQITMSSDSGGSMPIYDDKGELEKLTAGSPNSNIETFRNCINQGIDFETSLIPFTSSPAKLLKLHQKGEIKEGLDADLLILDKKLNLKYVIAKGKIMLENYNPTVFGTFES